MRRAHSKPSLADVHGPFRRELTELLPWRQVGGSLAIGFLVRLLGLMTCCRASLHAVMSRFGFGVCPNAARQAFRRHLPTVPELAARLTNRLVSLVPQMPRRGFHVAIDTHFVAYYGDRATPGIVRGQLKASTRKFFVYATACVVEQGRRYTLAMTPVESARPIAALGPLLADLARHGLRIRSLTLDKAFFAADVFARLDRDRIPYVVAVPHHRRAVTRFWRRRAAATADYSIRSRYPDRTPVTVRMRRVRYYRHGRQRTEVYAVAHLNHLTDNQLRATYRRRFAIESSYRQLRQVKPPTTSRDRTWRLLLIGLGLLFRQLWVVVQTAATDPRLRPWNPMTALSRLAWLTAQRWAKTLASSTQTTGPAITSSRRPT